jgi:hypothetical protein
MREDGSTFLRLVDGVLNLYAGDRSTPVLVTDKRFNQVTDGVPGGYFIGHPRLLLEGPLHARLQAGQFLQLVPVLLDPALDEPPHQGAGRLPLLLTVNDPGDLFERKTAALRPADESQARRVGFCVEPVAVPCIIRRVAASRCACSTGRRGVRPHRLWRSQGQSWFRFPDGQGEQLTKLPLRNYSR